jgi:hypothetical protein
MRKHVINIFVGLTSLLLTAHAAAAGNDQVGLKPVTANIMTRLWIEQALVNSISIDVPWPLRREELPIPPELAKQLTRSVTLSRDADGLEMSVSVMTFVSGSPNNLEGAADGMMDNLKEIPGTRTVNRRKRETTVLGARAIDVSARIEQKQGVPLQLRGLVFFYRGDFVQMLLISRFDDDLGATVWERIRDSIRAAKAR